MVRVSETDDPDAQLVLIVDNNPMATMRLLKCSPKKGGGLNSVKTAIWPLTPTFN